MFEVEFLSQRICIFYIVAYIVKLYIEKLYKYNSINNIWRYLFFFALASIGNHQYFNLC